MVEFFEDVKGKDFSYEEGKRYAAMVDLTEEFAKDKALEVCDYEMIKRNDLSIKNIIEFSSEEDYNNYFEK
mgnify:CR=1 FL=1